MTGRHLSGANSPSLTHEYLPTSPATTPATIATWGQSCGHAGSCLSPVTSFLAVAAVAAIDAMRLFRLFEGLAPETPCEERVNHSYGIPIEVHLLIIHHLDVRDFATYLCVCRAWRLAGQSDDVWPIFACRTLPGLAQYIRLEAEKSKDLVQGDLFRHVLMKINRRLRGHFTSALENDFRLGSETYFTLDRRLPINEGGVHSYDAYLNAEASRMLKTEHEMRVLRPSKVDTESTKKILWYAHGRIAWTSSITDRPLLVIIDDLRTRLRKAYSFPEQDMPNADYETALGSHLFVMASSHKMRIWHLDRNTCTSIALPTPLIRCLTEGERVLAITTNAEVYTWTLDAGLQALNMSGVGGYRQGELEKGAFDYYKPGTFDPPLQSCLALKGTSFRDNLNFILHPHDESALFVVTYFGGALIVHEFSDGSWKSYTGPNDISSSLVLLRNVLIRSTNSHGEYRVLGGVMKVRYASDNTVGLCCRHGSKETEISVFFNIYTKAFRVARHHFRGNFQTNWIARIPHYSIWNHQLLHPHLFERGYNILAIGECRQDLDYPSTERLVLPLDQIPIYAAARKWSDPFGPLKRQRIIVDSKSLPQNEEQYLDQGSNHQDVEYCLDMCRMNSPKHFWQTEHPNVDLVTQELSDKYVLGDDEFLLYICGNSYTVYDFNTSD